jgi:hypothetical protein
MTSECYKLEFKQRVGTQSGKKRRNGYHSFGQANCSPISWKRPRIHSLPNVLTPAEGLEHLQNELSALLRVFEADYSFRDDHRDH